VQRPAPDAQLTPGTDHLRPVLLCYDRSDDARRAIEHAARLFAGRPTIVLHVWEPVPDPPSGGSRRSPAAAKDAIAQLNSFAREVAEEIAIEGAAAAHPGGVRPEAGGQGYPERVLERADGGVAATIARVAEERDVAAVVLGSRGLSGDSTGVGSVAYAVVRDCRRPVVIVPASAGG
jgi:nucleotide-binding universal stress UspA family protein